MKKEETVFSQLVKEVIDNARMQAQKANHNSVGKQLSEKKANIADEWRTSAMDYHSGKNRSL
jgi:hypothetical protein